MLTYMHEENRENGYCMKPMYRESSKSSGDEVSVGVFCSSLHFSQPESLESLLPKQGGDYDVLVLCLLHSSYRVSADYLNAAHRLSPWIQKNEYMEPSGGHSPFRSSRLGDAYAWSWADDDGDELWVDVEPFLSECYKTGWRAKSNVEDCRLSREAHQVLDDEVAARLATAHGLRASARDMVRITQRNIATVIHSPECQSSLRGSSWNRGIPQSNPKSGSFSSNTSDAEPLSRSSQEKYKRLLRRASIEYLKILEHHPNTSGAWYGLGLAQRSLGENIAALRAFDACLRLRADGALDGGEAPGAAWNARARTMLRAERPLAALVSFRRALAVAPHRVLYASNVALLEDALRAKAEGTAEQTHPKTESPCSISGPGLELVTFVPSSMGDNDSNHSHPAWGESVVADQPKSVVSTARRLASEQRAAKFATHLEEYEREHAQLCLELFGREDSALEAGPRLGFAALGRELKRGAEHLARVVRLHIGRNWRLVASQRSGHLRLRVYSRVTVRHAHTNLVCANEAGMTPSSGSAAIAFKLQDGTTLCVAGLDLAASGMALEQALEADLVEENGSSRCEGKDSDRSPAGASIRRYCSHSTALRNRLACSTLATLGLGDATRSIGEQFDNVIIVGNLGYEPGQLEVEIQAKRAFAGFDTILGLEWTPSASAHAIARDNRSPMQFLWRSNSIGRCKLRIIAKQSATPQSIAAIVSGRPIIMPAASDKRKMPKLVIEHVRVTHMPCLQSGAPLRAYLHFGVEPPDLLWTSNTSKVRSNSVNANRHLVEDGLMEGMGRYVLISPLRCSASWNDEQFTLHVQPALTASCPHASSAAPSFARANIIISVWAYMAESDDSLVGLAQFALTEVVSSRGPFNLTQNITLDGRATGILTCVVQYIEPETSTFGDAHHQHCRSNFERVSATPKDTSTLPTKARHSRSASIAVDQFPKLINSHWNDDVPVKLACWRHTWSDRYIPWTLHESSIIPCDVKVDEEEDAAEEFAFSHAHVDSCFANQVSTRKCGCILKGLGIPATTTMHTVPPPSSLTGPAKKLSSRHNHPSPTSASLPHEPRNTPFFFAPLTSLITFITSPRIHKKQKCRGHVTP